MKVKQMPHKDPTTISANLLVVVQRNARLHNILCFGKHCIENRSAS